MTWSVVQTCITLARCCFESHVTEISSDIEIKVTREDGRRKHGSRKGQGGIMPGIDDPLHSYLGHTKEQSKTKTSCLVWNSYPETVLKIPGQVWGEEKGITGEVCFQGCGGEGRPGLVGLSA